MSLVQQVIPEPEIFYHGAGDNAPGTMVVQFHDDVQVRRYEDGSYKIVCKNSRIMVEELNNKKPGASRGYGAVRVSFVPFNRSE